MLKRQLFGLILCVTLGFQALAQNRTVTGKVTSAEDGSPLPGATVVVKGGATTTITNNDGEFTLSLSGNPVLVFSFIGFTKREVPVGNKSRIDVALEADSQLLNEMVVIGYGVVQKSKLTSAITSVAGKDLANLVTPSFDQQLAGRASGVQVTTGSGIIGQAPRIRIRGTNSITSGGSPLYVVDGVPALDGNQAGANVPSNPLGDINPTDIESIEILKDGAATAIYGSRANQRCDFNYYQKR